MLKVEIMQKKFSDHTTFKINKKKMYGKYLNTWK